MILNGYFALNTVFRLESFSADALVLRQTSHNRALRDCGLGPHRPPPLFPASISTLLDGCCPRPPMHTTDIATGDEVPTLRRAHPTPATVGLEMCRNSKCFLERGVGGGHKICIWLTLHLYDVLFKQ